MNIALTDIAKAAKVAYCANPTWDNRDAWQLASEAEVAAFEMPERVTTNLDFLSAACRLVLADQRACYTPEEEPNEGSLIAEVRNNLILDDETNFPGPWHVQGDVTEPDYSAYRAVLQADFDYLVRALKNA